MFNAQLRTAHMLSFIEYQTSFDFDYFNIYEQFKFYAQSN